MNIAILGGSFDPPHSGHLLIAKQVKEALPVDEIWLMPGFSHPFNKKMSLSKDRLVMSKYLTNRFIKASDFEIRKGGISYTINTLSELSRKRRNDKFYWIIGSDQLGSFRKWKDWRSLIKQYDIIVFPRPGNTKSIEELVKESFGIKDIPENIFIIENDNVIVSDVSSTIIRRRVQSNESITGLVPQKVEEYIISHKLYSKK